MMIRLALSLLFAFSLFTFGCGNSGSSSSDSEEQTYAYDEDEAYTPNSATWIEHDTPEPDFTEQAADPAYRAKLQRVAKELGGSATASENIPGLYLIRVNHDKAEASLNDWNSRFFNEGVYVFRLDNGYGFNGNPDVIGVLPTTDQFEVVRVIGTNGANYEMSNAYIIKWLRELHAQRPIIITGASFDVIEGRFQQPPGRDMALAKRMYAFCPDIVDQGTGDVESLADEIAEGSFFFWWD